MDSSALLHSFDAAIQLQREGEGVYLGHISQDYANFVGPFGGTIAAALLNAPMSHPERLGEPLSLTVNFCAPMADEPFRIHARAVRTNRSTQHWMIELTQSGETVATATVICAARRQTWSLQEARPPPAPGADAFEPIPVPPGLPRWIRNYDLRIVRGAILQETESEDSITTLWVRDQPPRPLDFLSLAAMSDIFFPRIFVRRNRMVPIGTVSMTVYFHADSAQLAGQGTEPLLATARGNNFRNGYFDHSASLWGVDDKLLVTTHQIVYYKE